MSRFISIWAHGCERLSCVSCRRHMNTTQRKPIVITANLQNPYSPRSSLSDRIIKLSSIRQASKQKTKCDPQRDESVPPISLLGNNKKRKNNLAVLSPFTLSKRKQTRAKDDHHLSFSGETWSRQDPSRRIANSQAPLACTVTSLYANHLFYDET